MADLNKITLKPWCVHQKQDFYSITQDGYYWCIYRTKREAIKEFLADMGVHIVKDWKDAIRQGYRCVKVTVVERS